jgi:hypothetical protein
LTGSGYVTAKYDLLSSFFLSLSTFTEICSLPLATHHDETLTSYTTFFWLDLDTLVFQNGLPVVPEQGETLKSSIYYNSFIFKLQLSISVHMFIDTSSKIDI